MNTMNRASVSTCNKIRSLMDFCRARWPSINESTCKIKTTLNLITCTIKLLDPIWAVFFYFINLVCCKNILLWEFWMYINRIKKKSLHFMTILFVERITYYGIYIYIANQFANQYRMTINFEPLNSFTTKIRLIDI